MPDNIELEIAIAEQEALAKYRMSSADPFPVVAPPPQTSFGEDFSANLTAAANTINPFADEAAAGIRSVLPGYQSYDEELAAIRGGEAAHSEARPYQSGASSVIGALASAPFIPTTVMKGAPLGINALRALAEGIGLGGVYGFGNAEGGLDERVEGAGKSAALSGAMSGALPLVGAAAKGVGGEFLKHGLNVQRSDAAKAARFLPKGSAERPLEDAIEGANSRGIFGVFDDPANTIMKNETAIHELGEQSTGILTAADKVGKSDTLPDFVIAKKFINKNPLDADALDKQLGERVGLIQREWDGTLSGLNKLKQGFYRRAYEQTTDSSDLDKMIAADMRQFIETRAGQILDPESAAQLRSTNATQGEHLTLRDLLEKENDRGQMAGGVPKMLRRMTVSPLGGAAVGAGASIATGNPLPLAGAVVASALGTRPGQMMMAKGAKALGSSAEAAAAAPGGINALSQLSAYLSGKGSSPTDAHAQGLPGDTAQAGDLSGIQSPRSNTVARQSGKAVQLLSAMSSSLNSASPQPGNQAPPAQFPRSSEAIRQNPEAFLQSAAALSRGNPQLMADIQSVLKEPNETKRDMALMNLASTMPQLFQPSPYRSLWNGRIYDPEEVALYIDQARSEHSAGRIDANQLARSISAMNRDGSIVQAQPQPPRQPQQVRLPTPPGQVQQYAY